MNINYYKFNVLIINSLWILNTINLMYNISKSVVAMAAMVTTAPTAL